ncbi:CotH kinase family protein, partial [Cnuella takakiae]
MRTTFLLLSILGFFQFYTVNAQTGIYINEAMGSNRNTIADSTGSFEDWLELYNPTSNARPLNGYYVTNDITKPQLFRLSGNLQIPARGYILLWASKDTTRGKTHLPFKISSSGERLYLFAPDGNTLVDSLALDEQKTDVSYGRTKDGSTTFGFFAAPTPRSTNNNATVYLGILNPPVFSQPAGFYGSAFSLSITSDDPAVKIVYTTDGSLPHAGNINGTVYRYKNKYQQQPTDPVGPFLLDSFKSFNYVNPINVKDASANPNKLSLKSATYENTYSYAPATLINKGTVVRAVATKDGYIPSEITTATYFVTPGGTNKYNLPVLSITLPENYLFSWDSGMYNAGADFEKWRTLNPTATPNGGTPANYNTKETEFPASFELFLANATTLQLQTNVGLTGNGGYSRRYGQKALRIYFRKSYGASDLNYKIFTDLPYTNYERLVLSNAGQDMPTAHMRDMVAQACVKHLNVGTQHQQPAVAFVNGEFWGLYNIRQRYDDNHFKQIWGIDPDSLDLIYNRSEVKYGTSTAILNLRSFFTANDLSVTENYQKVQTMMDIDNFIDYQLAEIFLGNRDWPANNTYCYRKRVPFTPGAPPGQDGRFRWALNDMDHTFGLYSSGWVGYNMLAWATGSSTDGNPSAWATDMLRKLLTNTEFRNKFITRYADLLNTTFLPVNINRVTNSYRDLLSPHIVEHIQRWRNPASATSWNTLVNNMIKYADQRPSYARQHIRSQFSLNTEQQLTINVSDTAQGFTSVNTIDITPVVTGIPQNTYPWTGSYYQEVPVTLVAKPKPGYSFVGWAGDSTSTKDTLKVTLDRAKSFTAIFQSKSVTESGKVITYWHFNTLPSTSTIAAADADTSLTGRSVITYPGTGAGYMDRTTGSAVNAQFNQPLGYSLRVRNPASTRYLLMSTPTTGYKNIILKYATVRTTSGAEYQRILYTNDVTNANVEWKLKADSIVVPSPDTAPYGLQSFDFSTDANTANNAKFAIKIEFFGNNAAGTSGNNRFDNMTISGVALNSQDFPTVSVSSDRDNVCSNSKITFTAKTTNAGVSPTFQWIKNDVNVGTNQSTFVDSSFQDGDVIFCTLTFNNTTLTSNKVFITVSSSNLGIASLTKNAPSACGINDGDITINQSGGVAPFSYSLNNVDYATSNLFPNLEAGNYTTYVKDAKGCIASLSDVLMVTPALNITLNKTSTSACGGNLGEITINVTGGTAPYVYSLNGVDYVTSNVFSNLAAGTYTAYVMDADNCVASITDILANASELVITSITKVDPSNCANNGSITINSSGGISPFKYSLDGVNYVTSNVFGNLAAGTYTAYVKDANGCTTLFTDVLSKLSSSVEILDLIKTSATSCGNDGSIEIVNSGGYSPFQYSLNNGEYITESKFNNLSAGTYTAYIKDAHGCIDSLTTILEKTPPIVISLKKSPVSACSDDGILTIIGSGGSSPYEYSLDGTVFFRDKSFYDLSAGTYTVYVRDRDGCVASITDVLTRIPLDVTASTTPASACNDDGSITINISEGTAPYQYSLNGLNYFTSNVFSNLTSGTYTAYVRDANGCTASTPVVIAKNAPLTITSVSKENPSNCKDDGSITINTSEGTAPFQYSLNGVDYVTSNVFSNLAAGNYTAYVKDARGCTASVATSLTKAAAIVVSTSNISVSACSTNDGKITINRTGGNSPFLYSINGVN